MKIVTTILAFGLFAAALPAMAQDNKPSAGPWPDKVVVLITEQEALAQANAELAKSMRSVQARDLTRLPKITLLSPSLQGEKLPRIVPFKLRFQSFGGAKIDKNSIRVLYLRDRIIDLTQRVQAFITVNGIDIEKAGIPAGNHLIQVEVADIDGRRGSERFEINVAE